jgi:shikimate dehydrogenase
MIAASTTVVAVIGDPVRHSLSPVMHNAAFAHAGLDWAMVALPVRAGDGAAAVSAARTMGVAGLAVTMPHKADVAAAADHRDATVQRLGVANTVVFDNGVATAHTTDGDGLVDAMVSAGHDPAGARVLIVGAGGAARSIVEAMTRRGARAVTVANRTLSRAEECAACAVADASVSAIDLADVGDRVAEVDIVVNTTSVGMAGTDHEGALVVPAAALRPEHLVVDIVYHPLQTPLLLAADAAGAATLDGLAMLVHQAVRQQMLWTSQMPPAPVLRAAALGALGLADS